jgi:hypothetical protein
MTSVMPRSPLVLWVALAVLVAACGKKAPPIRPERLVPAPVRVSELRNVADGVRLFWAAPKQRVDKKPLEGLRGFLIYRADGDSRQTCLAPGNTFRRVGTVQAEDAGADNNTLYSFLDADAAPGRWYVYRVFAEDLDGNLSTPPEGQPVIRRGAPPPQAPQPALTIGDGFLSFRMPAFPENVAGWYVYRGPTDAVLPTLPLFPQPVTNREYTDAGIVNDIAYQYAFSWLGYDAGFPVEGALSEPLVAAPRDLVPPPPPGSLVGVAVKNSVDLRWERVEEPGVRYHVYRRLESERAFRQLTQEPVAVNAFGDTVAAGRYVYAVTAVDQAGNESSRSPETAVRVR